MSTLPAETMQHLSLLLGYLQSSTYNAEDPAAVSGIIKRSRR